MNLLLATPCLTGFTHTYVSSLVGMVQGLELNSVRFNTLFLANESCIMRARNDIAHYAMTAPEAYTHLLMIDSDMGWEWDDFVRLANAKKRIISGMCVKKKYPLEFVFVPMDGEKSDLDGVLRVTHTPTAFMLIDLSTLHDLAPKVTAYRGVSAITGEWATINNFFPSGPNVDGNFQAEDHGFTSLMRAFGESIFMHTLVKTTHCGLHTFKGKDVKDETPLVYPGI